MKSSRWLGAFALSAAAFVAGCLPTVDPAKTTTPQPATATPPPAPEAAIPVTPVPVPVPADPAKPANAASTQLPPAKISTTQSQNGGAPSTHLKMAMQDQASAGPGNAVIRVEPQPDGNWLINGGRALHGTIKKDPAGGWLFEGTMTFPAKGYVVSEPFATSLDRMQGVTLEKSSDMTTLTIPFKYPPKDPKPELIEESFPLKLKFDAPEKTSFVVMLLPGL